MGKTVKYVSRRSEVMGWYWRMWRRQLWKTHLFVFMAVVISASFSIFDRAPSTLLELLWVAGIGLVPIAGFALFPLVKFKPQERTLVVDEAGLKTSIGKISKNVSWEEIASADMAGDNLIIENRNLNALIVPKRAFETPEAQKDFADFVLARVQTIDS
ncbi:YcxB family protein [Novosphingobium sp. BL-8H]|uniref:YcxB family protein n=1 Tax=Novosphingobium sp. BL-8H TaxID=3127640 RepID=UPI003756FD46